jgi:hypothetical protein
VSSKRKSLRTQSEGRKKALWASLFFGLALAVAFSGLAPDRAWSVAIFLFIGIMIVAVPKEVWKEILSRVENAKVGPVSIALQLDAGKAAASAAEPDTSEGLDGAPLETAKDMFDLRKRLEWKLAYIAKHLLAKNGNATFVTIGSLEYDGYLSEEEARTAIGIFNTREEELRELPKAAQETFLKDAGAFVDSVRASVFWGQAKRRLKGKDRSKDKNLLRAKLPSTGRRSDFLAGLPGKEFRVAPALALGKRSGVLKRAIKRLRDEVDTFSGLERQIVVIPDNSKEDEAPASGKKPRVVKLANLRSALEEA